MASGFQNFFYGKTDYKPRSTLNPEQEKAQQALGSFFQKPASDFTYSGPLTEPITPGEENAIGNYRNLNSVRQAGLTGILNPDIDAYNRRFDEQIYTPSLNRFRRDILPGIQEEYRSFGTPIADYTNQAYSRFQEGQDTLRFQGYEDTLNRIPGASEALDSAAKTTAAVESIPREIKNTEFGMKLANFYKGNEAYSTSINQMLNFLGIQTQVFEPKTTYGAMQYATDIANIVGSLKGYDGTQPSKTTTPTTFPEREKISYPGGY